MGAKFIAHSSITFHILNLKLITIKPSYGNLFSHFLCSELLLARIVKLLCMAETTAEGKIVFPELSCLP